MSWLDFWRIFLIVVLGAFALLGVVVGIGGWRDVRTMLARLGERREGE